MRIKRLTTSQSMIMQRRRRLRFRPLAVISRIVR